MYVRLGVWMYDRVLCLGLAPVVRWVGARLPPGGALCGRCAGRRRGGGRAWFRGFPVLGWGGGRGVWPRSLAVSGAGVSWGWGSASALLSSRRGGACVVGSMAVAGPQIHELVVVSAPPPRRDVTYVVRHSVPLDGVLISRNAPYAADCGRCLKGVMFTSAHSFACKLWTSTLM